MSDPLGEALAATEDEFWYPNEKIILAAARNWHTLTNDEGRLRQRWWCQAKDEPSIPRLCGHGVDRTPSSQHRNCGPRFVAVIPVDALTDTAEPEE